MSIAVAVLLGCTAPATLVCAHIAFRFAINDGVPRPSAWGAAGGAALAVITDVCLVGQTLDLRAGHSSPSRIAITVITAVLALFFGYVAYEVTGQTTVPAGTPPAPTPSKTKRLAYAAATFTGTFVAHALIVPLLM